VCEAEDFFLIEVPDNVRKIVIVKAQVHGVMIYYFGINSLLTAHSNTIYTLAVNTTGGTPEEKPSRHVTLVRTTNVFSL
jgi:hypothetical protein